MTFRRVHLLVAAFLCTAQLAFGATLAPGMAMPALALADQHDVKASITPETRLVIFARDMDSAEIAQDALEQNGAALLAGADALFVSDISLIPDPEHIIAQQLLFVLHLGSRHRP